MFWYVHDTYKSILRSPDHAMIFWHFCLVGKFANSQLRIVLTLIATSEICGKDHHRLSNSFWVPQYMA